MRMITFQNRQGAGRKTSFCKPFLSSFLSSFLSAFLSSFLSTFLCRRTQHIILNHYGLDMFVIRQLFRPVHIVINQFLACLLYTSGIFLRQRPDTGYH